MREIAQSNDRLTIFRFDGEVNARLLKNNRLPLVRVRRLRSSFNTINCMLFFSMVNYHHITSVNFSDGPSFSMSSFYPG